MTGVQSDSPLQISPRSPQGPAPHPTRFEVAYLGDPLTISAITIDYDGDGTVDQAALNPSENFEYTFSAPGIYHPTLTLATGSETYTAQTTVVVQSVAELDAFLKESWNSFNQSLLEGNIEAALQKMSHSARKKYGPAYETILPYIQQGIASYSEAEAIEIHANWAEYLVTREKDGEIYGFKVRMVRGIDGIWRINEL